jgi:hypothetical protein
MKLLQNNGPATQYTPVHGYMKVHEMGESYNNMNDE